VTEVVDMNDVEAELTAADRADVLMRLERELTDALLREIAEGAKPLVRRLRSAGVPVHSRMHHEMAQDAAIDTIEGRRPWDGTYPLVAHLHMNVKSRFLNMLKKQRKFRRESLGVVLKMDESNDDTRRRPADLASLDIPRPMRPSRVVSLRNAAEQVIASIREILADDPAALRVADAWERGFTERVDAIDAADLSPAVYDAAVKRIQRALKALPVDLREGAQDAMEVSYGA